MEVKKRERPWILPISIIIAGLMIAAGLYYRGLQSEAFRLQSKAGVFGSGSPENVKSVNSADHILGNPAAPVKIIEFSDPECPFCKLFHKTMMQVMQEYGQNGQVAWIYRQFPVDEIHSKARKEIQAVECANEIGGNSKFWAYLNRIFEITPSNNNLDLSLLPKIALDVGVDGAKFEACMMGDEKGGKYADHIEADYQDGLASGAVGTPYTIIISPNGKTYPIHGAQPFGSIKLIIDIALQEK